MSGLPFGSRGIRSNRIAASLAGVFLVLFYFAFPAPTLRAQSTSGVVLGAVTDQQDNVVPGAAVTLSNLGTGAKRSALTDGSGGYRFSNTDAGRYSVSVAAAGFQAIEFEGFDLNARETKRLDGQLKLATQSQTVNVESSAGSIVETDTSSIAVTKTGRELVDLPVAIATRASGSTSAMSTLTTQPGVQTDANGGISVAGALPTQLSVTIDGISTVGPRTDGPLTELFPSFNAIEEIRVGEVINAAEFGGIADITTISKSGSNQFHGGLFENFQNNALNAGNTFSHTTPTLKMNDFGAFLGGPVELPRLYNGHDKTFFFGSYEALRLPRDVVSIESVPSLALRQGDLSAYPAPITGFPGNIIPSSQISPLAQKALQYLYPLPNYGPPGAVSNNYLASFSEPINSSQGDLRVDENLTSNPTDLRPVTLTRTAASATLPTVLALLGALSQPEIDGAFTGAWNWVVSPTVINEFRLGFSGNHTATSFAIQASQAASELGLTNLPGPIPAGDTEPNFRIRGFQNTGGQSSNLAKNGTTQLLDTVTWTKGSHNMKFGADYRYLTGLYTNVFASLRLGSYAFNGSVMNSLLGPGAGTPFASFLLGYPDSTTIATVLQADTQSYASHYGFFAQDDWKVTRSLTINYGLRYEYHPMFRDHLNNLANFLPNYTGTANGATFHGAVVVPNQQTLGIVDPGFSQSILPTPILTAAQAGIPSSLRYSQRTDFAPRIGFAWRPFGDDKTVLRGGYGRFIEALLGSAILDAWAVESSDVGVFKNGLVNGTPKYSLPYSYPSNIAQPGTQSFDLANDIHYKDPFVQEWDLTLERDLGAGVALRLSYDGNHASNLGVIENLNQVHANTVGFSAANAAAPFPVFDYIYYQTNAGFSNYNAFTAAVQKRFSSGLQFQASYIYARNLSNAGGYDPTTAFAGEGGGTISDPFNPGLDYGNVNFTRRNRFLTTFLYELPFGKGKPFLNGANPFLSHLAGGWELAGVLLFQGGPFMTVLAPGDPSGTGFNQLVGDSRADTVPGVSPYAGQSLTQWVNPSAFTSAPDNIGRFGDSAVGGVTGPGTQAVSLSLFKTTYITERIDLKIGVSAANLFNHPNYAPPSNLEIGTPGFASLNSLQAAEAGGPRQLQLTARIDF